MQPSAQLAGERCAQPAPYAKECEEAGRHANRSVKDHHSGHSRSTGTQRRSGEVDTRRERVLRRVDRKRIAASGERAVVEQGDSAAVQVEQIHPRMCCRRQVERE